MRKMGHSFAEIGEALGIDLSTAYRDVAHVMKQLEEDAKESAAEILRIELERLDKATKALMPMLEGKARLQAIDRLVKIQDRRAKYLGLDQAQKGEVKIIKSEVYLPERDADPSA